MLAGRGPLLTSPALVSHLPSVPVLFLFFPSLGLGFASSPSRYPDPPSADLEDIDTVIADVAKVAKVEAEKIATEEAAKGAAEDTAKGPAGEPGKAAAKEAGKGPAGGPARPLPRRRWLTTNLPPPLPLTRAST